MGQKIFQWRASVDCLTIVLLLSLMFLFSSIPKSALNFKEILETSYTKKPKGEWNGRKDNPFKRIFAIVMVGANPSLKKKEYS